eukprot:m51a1_g4906 putative 3 -cyclic-nucleotide phosphodiesterase rega (2022) ;mRNA; f:165415-174760
MRPLSTARDHFRLVVPWTMARGAGLASVRAVAAPLLEKIATAAQVQVLAFLGTAEAAGLEARETFAWLRAPGNLTFDAQLFLRVAARVSPEMRLRYLALGYADGRMSGVMLDKRSGHALTHQRQWLVSAATGWNASFPGEPYDDLGPYNVTTWSSQQESTVSSSEAPLWWNDLYIEAPHILMVELVASFGVPIYRGNYLGTLDLTNRARALVVNTAGTVVGTSFNETIVSAAPDGLLQTKNATELTDPVMRAVANYFVEHTESRVAPFAFGQKSTFALDLLVSGRTTRVHVTALPTQNKYGLNWTTIVAVEESEYTEQLFTRSKSALLAGVIILVGITVVIISAFTAALIFMYSESRKIHSSTTKVFPLKTGLEQAVDILKRINVGDMSKKQINEFITRALGSLGMGVYRVDLKSKELDPEQEAWLTQQCQLAVPFSVSRLDLHQEAFPSLSISTLQFSVLSQGEDCFVPVCLEVVRHLGLLSTLKTTEETFTHFLTRIEEQFKPNPFHNSLHAAESTQFLCALIAQSKVQLCSLEKLALVLACIVHDLGHPGRTNGFLVASGSELALRYNDTSVLENYHLAAAWGAVAECQLLGGVDAATHRLLRRLVIALVLATDMAHHFQIVSDFSSRMATSKLLLGDDDRLATMKVMLKIAHTHAGFASIRAVAEPLLEKIATASQIQVLEFLHTAEAATLEATETLSWLRPPGNLTFELELFHRIGMRVSPEMRLRYIALGYEDGRMSCVMFDKASRRRAAQTVDIVDGNLTNQRQWLVSAGTEWNSSYPGMPYDDLGPYNVSSWTSQAGNGTLALSAMWVNSLYIERTGPAPHYIMVELLAVFGSVVFRYLATLDLTNRARAIVVNTQGTIVGTSYNESTIAALPNGVLQTKNMKAVATFFLESTERRETAFAFTEQSSWDLDLTVAGRRTRVYITVLPLRNEYGLDWTTIVAVEEREYTEQLTAHSRSALLAGIIILVSVTAVVIAAFSVALAVMFYESRKIQDSSTKVFPLKTGLEQAVDILKRIDVNNMPMRRISDMISRALASLGTGVYRVDLRNKELDSEQEAWLTQQCQLSAKAVASGSSKQELLPAALADNGLGVTSLQFSVLAQGDCFVPVCLEVARYLDLVQTLRISEEDFAHFLFKPNPFHNSLHAAESTQFLCALIAQSKVQLCSLEKLALVLACIVHDLGHPGRTNGFLVASGSELALRYNDTSVLENYHLAAAWGAVAECQLLGGVDAATHRLLRRLVIALVLATDMAHHFQIVSDFSSRMATSKLLLGDDDRLATMKVMLKIADLGYAARPREEAVTWAERLFEENLQQGDQERVLKMPVSAHMDRATASLPKMQLNFHNFICFPLFQDPAMRNNTIGRSHCRRLRLTLLEALLVLLVTGSVIAAGTPSPVVVPWMMARSAGVSSVRDVAGPLLEKIAAAARVQVMEFLHMAEAAGLEAHEALKYQRPPGDLTFEVGLFYRIGMRVSPDMRLRYICMGYVDGRVSSVMFDEPTQQAYLQTVDIVDGNQTHLRQWRISPDTGWNASYPGAPYDDLDYLATLDLTQRARVLVVSTNGTIVATSYNETIFDKLPDGLIQTKNYRRGLNWTTIVAVEESGYTDRLYRNSRSALLAGIIILIGITVVIISAFTLALIVMYSESRKIHASTSTGLEKAVDTLKRINVKKMSQREVTELINCALGSLGTGVYNVDLKNKDLDPEQEAWLAQECQLSLRFTDRYQMDVHSEVFPDLGAGITSLQFSVLSQGDCFVPVCLQVVKHFDLMPKLGVTEEAFTGFLARIEEQFKPNPFHNSLHAAESTQFLCALIAQSKVQLCSLEKLALVLACIVHDLGHPGRTNGFLVASGSELALRYNDTSVLENYHLAAAWGAVAECQLLGGVDAATHRLLRRLVIALVLATDMAHHFQIVSDFSSRMATSKLLLGDDDRLATMKVMLKIADLGYAARPREEAVTWAERLFEENLQQGDQERVLKMPVSAHMDRATASLPKMQLNFHNFICFPLFQGAQPAGAVAIGID